MHLHPLISGTYDWASRWACMATWDVNVLHVFTLLGVGFGVLPPFLDTCVIASLICSPTCRRAEENVHCRWCLEWDSASARPQPLDKSRAGALWPHSHRVALCCHLSCAGCGERSALAARVLQKCRSHGWVCCFHRRGRNDCSVPLLGATV